MAGFQTTWTWNHCSLRGRRARQAYTRLMHGNRETSEGSAGRKWAAGAGGNGVAIVEACAPRRRHAPLLAILACRAGRPGRTRQCGVARHRLVETEQLNDPETNGVTPRLIDGGLSTTEDLDTDGGPWAIVVAGDLVTTGDSVQTCANAACMARPVQQLSQIPEEEEIGVGIRRRRSARRGDALASPSWKPARASFRASRRDRRSSMIASATR
jgi:hypothetical protein